MPARYGPAFLYLQLRKQLLAVSNEKIQVTGLSNPRIGGECNKILFVKFTDHAFRIFNGRQFERHDPFVDFKVFFHRIPVYDAPVGFAASGKDGDLPVDVWVAGFHPFSETQFVEPVTPDHLHFVPAKPDRFVNSAVGYAGRGFQGIGIKKYHVGLRAGAIQIENNEFRARISFHDRKGMVLDGFVCMAFELP